MVSRACGGPAGSGPGPRLPGAVGPTALGLGKLRGVGEFLASLDKVPAHPPPANASWLTAGPGDRLGRTAGKGQGPQSWLLLGPTLFWQLEAAGERGWRTSEWQKGCGTALPSGAPQNHHGLKARVAAAATPPPSLRGQGKATHKPCPTHSLHRRHKALACPIYLGLAAQQGVSVGAADLAGGGSEAWMSAKSEWPSSWSSSSSERPPASGERAGRTGNHPWISRWPPSPRAPPGGSPLPPTPPSQYLALAPAPPWRW